jgi:hypothetical protein
MSDPNTGRRGQHKSAERLAIEKALQLAHAEDRAIFARSIADNLGLRDVVVTRCLGNLVRDRFAHRIEGPRGLYRWGPAPGNGRTAAEPSIAPAGTLEARAHPAPAAQPKPAEPSFGTLGGCHRPGAMDAFSKPSLVDGVAVERRRPVILGSSGANGFKSLVPQR